MLQATSLSMTDVDNDLSELSFLMVPTTKWNLWFYSAEPFSGIRYDPAPNYFGTDSCPFYPTDGFKTLDWSSRISI